MLTGPVRNGLEGGTGIKLPAQERWSGCLILGQELGVSLKTFAGDMPMRPPQVFP